jgi:hypothetical protein
MRSPSRMVGFMPAGWNHKGFVDRAAYGGKQTDGVDELNDDEQSVDAGAIVIAERIVRPNLIS